MSDWLRENKPAKPPKVVHKPPTQEIPTHKPVIAYGYTETHKGRSGEKWIL